MLHEDTKVLIKALAKRADSDPKVIREAFQLENEKFAAYTIVSQLRNHIQGGKMARWHKPLKPNNLLVSKVKSNLVLFNMGTNTGPNNDNMGTDTGH